MVKRLLHGTARRAERQTGSNPTKQASRGPRIADALGAEALRRDMVGAALEAVIHALTGIPKRGPLWPSHLSATNQLRVYGTRNLLDAAIAAGAQRFVAESMVFIYGFGDLGDVPLTEDTSPRATFTRPWLRSAVDALVQ